MNSLKFYSRLDDFEEDEVVIDPTNYPPKLKYDKEKLDSKIETIR